MHVSYFASLSLLSFTIVLLAKRRTHCAGFMCCWLEEVFIHVRSCSCIPLTSASMTGLYLFVAPFFTFHFHLFSFFYLPYLWYHVHFLVLLFLFIFFSLFLYLRLVPIHPSPPPLCKMIAVKLLPTPGTLMKAVLRWTQGERGTNCTLCTERQQWTCICALGWNDVNVFFFLMAF